LKELLIKRKSWPFEGMWAIPGGFVDMEVRLCLNNWRNSEPTASG
jgi:ADP-ribose pyrophosphatase YjhB (NUDIX family)